MSSFISRLHADLRRTLSTRRGATMRDAKNLPQGTHKEYARMERIALPDLAELDMTLVEALMVRKSTRQHGGDVPLTLADCGALFGSLRKHPESLRRPYPSGGALYPVESYLITTALADGEPGVCHYHPTAHALERLWNLPAGFDIAHIVPHPEWLASSALIVFTCVWNRSSAKYGDLAYLNALLEVGHMSQNMLLVAAALGLQARPLATFKDQLTVDLLDLDDELEQPVYMVALSKGASTHSALEELEE